MSKLIDYYSKNISPEWRLILDKVGFAQFLFDLEKDYKNNTLVPRNPFDLLSPFLICPYNDLRVVIVGPHIEPANTNSNGLYMGGVGGYDEQAVKVIYQLSYEENSPIERFDFTMFPWAKQGVLMINSVPVSSSSQYDVYSARCLEITDKILTILQEKLKEKPMVFVYVDYDGKCKNIRVPLLRFKQDFIYGSYFYEEINKTLNIIKQRPIDWMAIKRENIIYDVEKLMRKARRS